MEMKGRKGAGVKNLAKSALIVGLCTLLALALRELGARPENCLMVYLTGVIILTIETQGYLLSLAASLLSVALFNFLFTEPLYTLRVSDPNQLLTMGVFLVIALLTSMLVTRLQAGYQHGGEQRDHQKNAHGEQLVGVAHPQGVQRFGKQKVEQRHAQQRGRQAQQIPLCFDCENNDPRQVDHQAVLRPCPQLPQRQCQQGAQPHDQRGFCKVFYPCALSALHFHSLFLTLARAPKSPLFASPAVRITARNTT